MRYKQREVNEGVKSLDIRFCYAVLLKKANYHKFDTNHSCIINGHLW